MFHVRNIKSYNSAFQFSFDLVVGFYLCLKTTSSIVQVLNNTNNFYTTNVFQITHSGKPLTLLRIMMEVLRHKNC